MFYRELIYWNFPGVEQLERRLKLPQQLVDLFKVEPTCVDDEMSERWKKLGPLNLYDMVSKNHENSMNEPEYNESLKISLVEDSIKMYYGQVDSENKRSGFGRYVSLFNGSIYEGHCHQGQQNGFGRLI